MAPESIEDIVLDRDRRGVSALRPHVPPRFCSDAAALILEHPGTALIATGFYILAGKATETDGPPGAVVIGDALASLGYTVAYVTDRYSFSVMSSVVGDMARVIDFPITNPRDSESFARDLLAEVSPSVVVAIERCGATREGLYRNMHGQDMTPYNARLDYLFTRHQHTVGIGDGGNEIGMGNLASVVATVPSLVKLPCVTPVTRLILSSVSNWGGYGLVAALSEQTGRDLLPSREEEQALVKRTADAGAIDGMSAKQVYKVDGFTLEENSETVERLRAYLAG